MKYLIFIGLALVEQIIMLLITKEIIHLQDENIIIILPCLPQGVTVAGYDFYKIIIHSNEGVHKYFNQYYINTEIFPKKLGYKISLAQSIREESDYDDEYVASKEKTQNQIETAEELIIQVEQYIEKFEKNSEK